MRRWFLVLLMAVLPLQFAQAAAAAYCGHEKAVANQHPGHHEHEHQEAAADGAGAAQADPDGKLSGTVDPDCEYCHLSCAQPLGSVAPSWSGTREHPVARSATHPFASLDGEDVERPKWSSAARSAGGLARHS